MTKNRFPFLYTLAVLLTATLIEAQILLVLG